MIDETRVIGLGLRASLCATTPVAALFGSEALVYRWINRLRVAYVTIYEIILDISPDWKVIGQI